MISRLRALADQSPARVAVTNAASVVTYSELLEHAEAVARLLKSGEPQTRVLVALPGGPRFTAFQLGCSAAGALFVPVPPRATVFELKKYVGLVEPDLLVAQSAQAARAMLDGLGRAIPTIVAGADSPDVAEPFMRWADVVGGRTVLPPSSAHASELPPDATMVQFTSGSTGNPKGILLSNASQLANLDANRVHLSSFQDRHVFCPVPQFHAMGNAVVLEHLLHGSPVHLANDMLYGEHLARMRRHSCRAILAPPHYFKLLMRARVFTVESLPCLDSVTIGTSLVDQPLVSQIRSLFPTVTVYCRYGVSESVGTLLRLAVSPHQVLEAPGLVGFPVPGVMLAPGLCMLGEGDAREIRVKHRANAIGVLLDEGGWRSLLDADGFLPTGDLGFLDSSGRVHLRGRISEFLKVGGHRVNPFEIEEVMLELRWVSEAVVIGVADDLLGQRIGACIEVTQVGISGGLEVLLAHCRSRLSPHKIPHEVRFVRALPRTHSGKPDRRKVAALFEPNGS